MKILTTRHLARKQNVYDFARPDPHTHIRLAKLEHPAILITPTLTSIKSHKRPTFRSHSESRAQLFPKLADAWIPKFPNTNNQPNNLRIRDPPLSRSSK